jgi:hypothetical protein
VVGAACQQKDLAPAAPWRFLTAPLLSRADEGLGPWAVSLNRSVAIARRSTGVFRRPVAPCISCPPRSVAKSDGAAADGSPCAPGEPVREYGAPSVYPNIPNSRRGRVASPHVQGREMDVFIGIDVSKDRLDICVRPSGETFIVTRDDQGLAVISQ